MSIVFVNFERNSERHGDLNVNYSVVF